MQRLYLIYSEDRTGGEIEDLDDQWSHRSDEEISLDFRHVSWSNTSDRFFCDSREVPDELSFAKKIYVLVVRYSDGDTFGHTSGHYSFERFFGSLAELEAAEKSLDTSKWNHYFGRFEGIECYECDMDRSGNAVQISSSIA